ncbi:unnamed protein product [Echinostoma caproni]|uniref:Uncharacterized protein n=1 Tax=Echinostoma caproni TaxID=27848 RepID=A0A183BCF5_9TREM|nr:unnamed protein product [Echinostoma caproni]
MEYPPTAHSPNVYEAVDHRHYHPDDDDAVAFSSADVGDFLSHNARDEDPVDPDLDLDLYSLATHTSSVRWSSDSPLRAPSADGPGPTVSTELHVESDLLNTTNCSEDTRETVLTESPNTAQESQSPYLAPDPATSP